MSDKSKNSDQEAAQASRYPRSELGRELETVIDKMATNQQISQNDTATAVPMHQRDRWLYVVLTWASIPTGIVVAGFVAIGSGFPHWGAAFIVLGAAGMYAVTLHLLEKKPLKPKEPSGFLIGCAIVTWIFLVADIGLRLYDWRYPQQSTPTLTTLSSDMWPALSGTQVSELASRVRFIPPEDIVVACTSINCKELSDGIAEILRKTAGWRVSIDHRGGIGAIGVIGIQINPNEADTAALKDTIEATTGIPVTLGPDTRKNFGSNQTWLVIGTRPF